ncbi:MAG: peptidoglycan-associated lipoprotein Pal [Thermodesulfobacteriota bacterium]|nr:peptidoglycan-associated lipoprotein Pal [Thermodesulfobacteriota bacterium]
MLKRLSVNFLLIVLTLSLSFCLSACGKDAVKDDALYEEVTQLVEEEPEISPEEVSEQEELLREEQLREEALAKAKQREKAEAARREAKLKEEFENVDIHFDFDEFSLTAEAREILAKKASWLLDHPDIKVDIEGHCDERGTNEYNLALGERRANSAEKYLVAAGVEARRISTISYGEERPLDTGHNETAWEKNRRVHLRIR